jgi:hypothetical protein
MAAINQTKRCFGQPEALRGKRSNRMQQALQVTVLRREEMNIGVLSDALDGSNSTRTKEAGALSERPGAPVEVELPGPAELPWLQTVAAK